MKATFNRKDFIGVLKQVNGFTLKSEADPILTHTMMRVGYDRCQIKSTNLDASIVLFAGKGEITEEGSCLINANKIIQILNECSDDEFAIESDENNVTIKVDGGKFKMPVYSTSEFPDFPTAEGESFLIGFKQLLGAIKGVIFNTAKEATRYTLNGVLFDLNEKDLCLVATDGKRLGLSHFISDYKGEKTSFIVPASSLVLLKQIACEEDAKVLINFTSNHVFFTIGDTQVTFKLLEGRFPKYKDVLPEKNIGVAFKTENLLRAVKQSAFFTDDRSSCITLEFKEKEVSLSATYRGEASVSCETLEEIPDELLGMKLGFSPKYFQDVLAHCDENVTVEFKDEDTAIRVENLNATYIIMPVSLKS